MSSTHSPRVLYKESQKMLRQVQKLCYCDKERTGRHIFHGSFTNVLSGYMTDISLLSPITVGDGVPEEETYHYGHRRANIVRDRKFCHRRGNNVTNEVDVFKPEQLHHLVSSVQGKVVCRHVGSLRSQIYICS